LFVVAVITNFIGIHGAVATDRWNIPNDNLLRAGEKGQKTKGSGQHA
jgi:hypothetical protein|tara:strand:+ start:1552 stop:1692 length:141 start_codon:yes stop_codon:yes gene_type:complete